MNIQGSLNIHRTTRQKQLKLRVFHFLEIILTPIGKVYLPMLGEVLCVVICRLGIYSVEAIGV